MMKEKENAELKEKLNNLASVAEVRLANWQKCEKENTELKESVTKFSKDGLDFLHSIRSNRNCIDCESKMSIQLNKAKEIIKRLMDIINHDLKCFDTMAGLDIKQKAEQFLKEE